MDFVVVAFCCYNKNLWSSKNLESSLCCFILYFFTFSALYIFMSINLWKFTLDIHLLDCFSLRQIFHSTFSILFYYYFNHRLLSLFVIFFYHHVLRIMLINMKLRFDVWTNLNTCGLLCFVSDFVVRVKMEGKDKKIAELWIMSMHYDNTFYALIFMKAFLY